MKRPFYVIHSHGAAEVWAESAAQAVRRAFIPAGFRDAQAVIDASFIISSHTPGMSGPLIAVAGIAAVPEALTR